jgi:hypothetical protein
MHNHINPNDYQTRLDNSIVVYDGWPVSLSVGGRDSFHLRGIWQGSNFREKDIKPADPLLDVSTPNRFGYFNYSEKSAYFIERHPVRRWRQGVCSSNCTVYLVSGETHSRRNRDDASVYMFSQGFEKMVRGTYPTVDECLAALETKEMNSIAPSPNICLSKGKDIFNVWYKKDKVGYITPGQKIVRVPSEPMSHIISKFLRELPWRID